VGILRVAALEFAPVDLWVRCKMSPEEVERLPSPAAAVLLGVSLPVMEMWPLEFSAPAKLRRAIEHLGAGD
jgi:hypothetical protein